MSNYAIWDTYSLGRRAIEWRERMKDAVSEQQRKSYAGELAVIEKEFDARFFTGPHWPDEAMREYWDKHDQRTAR